MPDHPRKGGGEKLPVSSAATFFDDARAHFGAPPPDIDAIGAARNLALEEAARAAEDTGPDLDWHCSRAVDDAAARIRSLKTPTP